MLRIGITGGYGSGKSTAARYFEERGYPVVYADPLAKKLMTDNPEVRIKLVSLMGEGAYHADGTLNKKYIADLIFSDSAKKSALERVVHPVVLTAVTAAFSEFERNQSTRMAFVEAALIFESHMEKILDYVVAITAPEDVRIRRIVERDGINREEIRERITAQYTDEYLKSKADFSIENTGDITHLNERCSFLENLFLSIGTTK
jgi:dephospho-CoA kinase